MQGKRAHNQRTCNKSSSSDDANALAVHAQHNIHAVRLVECYKRIYKILTIVFQIVSDTIVFILRNESYICSALSYIFLRISPKWLGLRRNLEKNTNEYLLHTFIIRKWLMIFLSLIYLWSGTTNQNRRQRFDRS